MKKVILLALVLLGLSAGAQNLALKNGLWCDANGNPFTGEITVNDTKGQRESEAELLNGKYNGAITFYFPDGAIMETGNYSAGIKHGVWTRYNEKGQKVSFGTYNEGKKDGKCLIWDNNGIKRTESNYNNGEKMGTWYNWDSNGNLIETKVFGQS
jgi:antitoxin component YwqK of YwqJK toxin-antitoxin module